MSKYVFIFTLVVSTIQVIGQSAFEIFIDTGDDDCILTEAAIDNSGNILVVGDVGPFYPAAFDALIIKVFPNGDYLMKRFDLGDSLSMFNTVNVLDDGNFFVTGSYSPSGQSSERDRLWVVILDEELNLVSQKTYPIRDSYITFGSAICSIIDNDGNIVLTSLVLEEEKDEMVAFLDFAFYKFTPNGDTLLSRYYSYIYDEIPYELTKVPNSDDLMLIERATLYNNHIELMYLDKDLNILKVNQLWSSLGGDPSCDYWLSDTEFLVSGRIGIETGGPADFSIGVYRVDTAANFLQELLLNKVDTTDYPAWRNSMAYANDSTIYIGGFQNIMGFWNTEPSIVELYMIDKDMNLIGYKELGGDYNYELWGIIATQDDGCLLYGTRLDVPEPERDIQIWKVLRDDINIVTGVYESPTPAVEIDAYPNPVTDKLFVRLSGTASWNHNTLCIYTTDGRQVFRKRIHGEGNLLQADMSNLSPGHYIISIEQNNKNTYTTKIVKQ